MAERFLMVLEEGPFPGEYEAPSELKWPLPEEVAAKGHITGAYKKTWESKGPASADGNTIRLRGAKYTWKKDVQLFGLGE